MNVEKLTNFSTFIAASKWLKKALANEDPNSVPEENANDINDRDLRRRARYLSECKRKLRRKEQGTLENRRCPEPHNGEGWNCRGAKLRTKHSVLERAVQHLYPLELQCDSPRPTARVTRTEGLDANAKEFLPRRDAAKAGELCIQDHATEEREEQTVEW
eukprot:gene11444-12640_t